MTRKGFLLQPGVREYNEILGLQRRIHAARRLDMIPDTVMFLEHEPCITIGNQGNHEHILASRQTLDREGIRVYETDRGGDVTYHGPGQIICYPIIDLKNHRCDVIAYGRTLEETFIRTLRAFGIPSQRKKGHPGVWVEGHGKIAARGVMVSKWITMHGVSLNVCPVMNHFRTIIPCGLIGYRVVSMEEYLGHAVAVSTVLPVLQQQVSSLFDIELEDIGEAEILERIGHA